MNQDPSKPFVPARCDNCRFFHRFGEEKRGECRRFPPQVAGSFTQFPPTSLGGWCGEHEWREAEASVKTKVKPDTIEQAARARRQ
jgi:hypothetical protein